MTRNLKHLGLLVGALLALGGLMATAASAHVAAEFTTGQAVTTIRAEGVGTPVLALDGYEVSCGIVTFHGSSSVATALSQTIKPTYTECEAFGLAAEIRGFGHYGEAASETCDYRLRADGKLDQECPTGRDLTIRAGGGLCIAHVTPQSGIGTITYTTENKVVASEVKHDLRLHIALTGLTTTLTDAGGFFCPFTGDTHVTNGTLTGTATAWAQDPETGALVDLTWDATIA